VLPPGKVAAGEHACRFVREAEAASALNYPGVVTIFAIGSEDGADFIVMESLGGRSTVRIRYGKKD